jgi:hypothetical protein
MDFKSLRAAKNKKAQSLIDSSSGGKIDASTFTPSELLNADVKTGMRPISRRAFKTGGKVDGDEAKSNLSRASRGFKETVGLANTNQKDANEEREGKKHIGGFKRGGRTMKNGGGGMEDDARKVPLNQYGKPITQEDLDMHAGQVSRSKLAPTKSPRPMSRPLEMDPTTGKPESAAATQKRLDMSAGYKRGGKADKFEGSAKDEMQDKKLAAKRGMSMKDWEASKADDKHDKQESMKGLKSGGKAEEAHDKGCTCKACGGAMMGKKDGGGLYANINAKRERGDKMRDAGDKGAPDADDFKKSARTARATGGRTKGTTNISINVMPHTPNKPTGIMPPPPMPPVGAPPPMGDMSPPPPPPSGGMGGMPPGLMAAMSGAAGTAPAGPNGPPPMMGRKSGGKVYPKMHFGAGGGKGRLEKVDEYGKNA